VSYTPIVRLDAPAEVPAREQVEQALAVLGDQVEDVLSDDRSPELLHEFYASVGLGLTWTTALGG
jgi:hypothetical protein